MAVSDKTECAAVLLKEHDRALATDKPDFLKHLLGGPKVEDFAIQRDRDTGREIDV